MEKKITSHARRHLLVGAITVMLIFCASQLFYVRISFSYDPIQRNDIANLSEIPLHQVNFSTTSNPKTTIRTAASPLTKSVRVATFEEKICLVRPPNITVPPEWKHRCPKYGIVTVIQGGRLGNQMWEYASVYSNARKSGLEAFVPRCILDTLHQYFENLSLPPLSYIGGCTVDENLVVNSLKEWTSPEQSILLQRWIIDWPNTIEWFADLRREFTFKRELREMASSVLKMSARRFNMSAPTFVGVHVRRTDYIGWLQRRLHAQPASSSYYLGAMDYFESKYKDVIFVVVSDSVDWCKKNLRRDNSRIDVISEPNEKGPGRDMAVLSICNHTILDYGTFGDWGAVLNGGETVVYNTTGHATTKIAQHLPNWKIMS